MCVSGYMLLKIRVGRSDYFYFFYFSVCHVVSRLVAPSFSLANSLISADALSAARERYKTLLVKLVLI